MLSIRGARILDAGCGTGRVGGRLAAVGVDAATAGLPTDLLLSTWDLRPFTSGSDFLVAVLTTG